MGDPQGTTPGYVAQQGDAAPPQQPPARPEQASPGTPGTVPQQSQTPQSATQPAATPPATPQTTAPPEGMAAGAPTPGGSRIRQGRSLLQPITVDDVVADEVVTIERDAPVRTAVAKMSDRDVGSVVVVDDRQPIGILTDRKVALALEETPDVADRPTEELLGRDLITIDPSTTIFEAIQLLRDEGIRRLPVVDDAGRLQGIVTLDDALVLLASELDKIATTVQAQSQRL